MATAPREQREEPVLDGGVLRGVLIASALSVPFWVISGALVLKALVQ
ncbi:hypothetical protein FHT02_003336 [Sphingomonas xinjiangensis]|uniref:Uncharacterized protein n=1 Tax=Sphingomonas xinjiangensis TaxID=643568 RepID=A0A840YPB7_9SPHN|nr:hypothetical protein [Sphingomonas xinjiangensis]